MENCVFKTRNFSCSNTLYLIRSAFWVPILINPNLTDYTEKGGNKDVQISQLTVNHHTKDTKIVELNFSDKNIQTIDNGDKKIDIKLMNIGTENLQGQDFMFFEIFVSEQE